MSARYKVYIIDEVHMLSRNAFNALLKTLEEPPPHTKFIFATTEIRKVPVTVLSRCQRFDLRRVDQATLTAHFAAIAEKEDVRVEPDALAMIARAADGSVRDGLSLLDQAIALAAPGNAVTVTTAQVGDMLGLADRTVVIDLFDATVRGDAKRALALLADLHAAGADPLTIVQDLLELTHPDHPAACRARARPVRVDPRGRADSRGRSGPKPVDAAVDPGLAGPAEGVERGSGRTGRLRAPWRWWCCA